MSQSGRKRNFHAINEDGWSKTNSHLNGDTRPAKRRKSKPSWPLGGNRVCF